MFFFVKMDTVIDRVFLEVSGKSFNTRISAVDQIQPPDYGEDSVENVDDIRKKLQSFDPANDPDSPNVRFPCSCLDPVLEKDKS